MRIETKARREGTPKGTVAQGGAGESSTALLVRLLGNRQSPERFSDQDCSPISLLNFEPFGVAVRPNGLRVSAQQTLQNECETKRPARALNKGTGGELLTGDKAEGPRREQRF
jgi:hypothetical protein